ncbi:MAG: Crp/Fnr family transcriptional regulator [Bdellovibrio sp.]|nr:Crp/Fnr family transcriptional regulator [Bdellovibrio sp.]
MQKAAKLRAEKNKKTESVVRSTSHCDTCPSKEKSVLCGDPAAVELIDKVKVTCHFAKDQNIFLSGANPLGLFSVQSGLVKLESVSENGNAHTLRLYGPGDVIGYRSLFSNESYKASAIAMEDTVVCFIPKNEIFCLFNSHPNLMLNLIQFLSKDLGHAENKWVDQMDKAALARVAEAILFLSEQFDHAHWTRKEIADWAGTTSETVIRTLSQFEKDGLIRLNGRDIEIVDRAGLEVASRQSAR